MWDDEAVARLSAGIQARDIVNDERRGLAKQVPRNAERMARQYNELLALRDGGSATPKQLRKLRMIERRFYRVETMKRHLQAKADGKHLVRRPVKAVGDGDE